MEKSEIVVEYAERSGFAIAFLLWSGTLMAFHGADITSQLVGTGGWVPVDTIFVLSYLAVAVGVVDYVSRPLWPDEDFPSDD